MTRTHDLLITNQLLYRLSYTSMGTTYNNGYFSTGLRSASRAEKKISVKLCYNPRTEKEKIGKSMDCIFHDTVLN